MSWGRAVYSTFFSRTSTAVVTVVAAAFFLERGVSGLSDYAFDTINQGVSMHYFCFSRVSLGLNKLYLILSFSLSRNNGRT